jgi:hypothetical protein
MRWRGGDVKVVVDLDELFHKIGGRVAHCEHHSCESGFRAQSYNEGPLARRIFRANRPDSIAHIVASSGNALPFSWVVGLLEAHPTRIEAGCQVRRDAKEERVRSYRALERLNKSK